MKDKEQPFNFNTWKNLYIENPEEFEKSRKAIINKFIDSASEIQKHRLQGLQFQIDAKRVKKKNAYSSCIAISKMMLESLQNLKNVIDGKLPEKTPSKLLKFPVKKSNTSKEDS